MVKRTLKKTLKGGSSSTKKTRRTRYTRSVSPKRTRMRKTASSASSEASRVRTAAVLSEGRKCKGLNKAPCNKKLGCKYVGAHKNAEGNKVKGKCYDRLGSKFRAALSAARKAAPKKTRTRLDSCERITRRSQCNKKTGCAYVSGYRTTFLTKTGKPKRVKARCYRANGKRLAEAKTKRRADRAPKTVRTRLNSCERIKKKANCKAKKGCSRVAGYMTLGKTKVTARCYKKNSTSHKQAKAKRKSELAKKAKAKKSSSSSSL